jgi:fatty acid desaturase
LFNVGGFMKLPWFWGAVMVINLMMILLFVGVMFALLSINALTQVAERQSKAKSSLIASTDKPRWLCGDRSPSQAHGMSLSPRHEV